MATRYWIGGAGTWDTSDTSHWSSTSGGAGGASAPTYTDNVVFDDNSGAQGYVSSMSITINTTVSCNNLSSSVGLVPGPTGSLWLTGTGIIQIYGNISLDQHQTLSSAVQSVFVFCGIDFKGTGTKTVDFGTPVPGNHMFIQPQTGGNTTGVRFDGDATWTLLNEMYFGGTPPLTRLMNGTLVTGAYFIVTQTGANFSADPGTTLTLTGGGISTRTFLANGTADEPIVIEGGSILISSASSVSYVDVHNNTAGGTGTLPFLDYYGTNRGGNVNWEFPNGVFAPFPSLVTTVKRVAQNLSFPSFVLGGRGGIDGTEFALFKKSTGYVYSVWKSRVYNIGTAFDVLGISLNLVQDLTANTSIVPVLYLDDGTTVVVGDTIDNTNYSNQDKLIKLTSKNFANQVHGESDLYLELRFTGTELMSVALPIHIELEVDAV